MSSFFSCRSGGVSLADCFPDSVFNPGLFCCPIRSRFRGRSVTGECDDSGTVRGEVFVLPECRGGVEGF
jgi:hypothetical protein